MWPTASHLLPEDRAGSRGGLTMGWTHVTLSGKENRSLWPEGSGQDVYSCLKKSRALQPKPFPTLPKGRAARPPGSLNIQTQNKRAHSLPPPLPRQCGARGRPAESQSPNLKPGEQRAQGGADGALRAPPPGAGGLTSSYLPRPPLVTSARTMLSSRGCPSLRGMGGSELWRAP